MTSRRFVRKHITAIAIIIYIIAFVIIQWIKPVFIYKLPNFFYRFFGKSKFDSFYNKLIDLNIVKWFESEIDDWSYKPIDNTQYVSKKIVEEYTNYVRNN